MGGVQRTTDFLEKSTWYLVVVLFVACIGAGIYNGNSELNVGIDENTLTPTNTVSSPNGTDVSPDASSPNGTDSSEEG
jgi:preprotein translocase subunit SecG